MVNITGENICTVNTVITSMVNITGENICTVNTVITSMVNITGENLFINTNLQWLI